jgi:hypothetical protein
LNKTILLARYLPPAAAPIIARWIDYFHCEFKISRNRSSKYGDYRHPFGNAGHRISVNYDLNPYAFLVTTVHEFAHLLTWNEYKNKVKPHGAEWKNNFRRMMKPFFEKQVFPPDVSHAIICYLENPSASSCTDLTLLRALRNHDTPSNGNSGSITVEKLPPAGIFKMKNGRVFRKDAKIRKRYRCTELKTGRVYLFNPLAEVFEVELNS